MNGQLEWQDRKAKVKADLDALLDIGIPLDTARSMVGWNVTLEYANFADVTAWPPPLVTPTPNLGIRESLRLMVSRSADRVNAENLKGAVLDAGKLYSVFIPDIPELNLLQINFLLNGVSQHVEFATPWDYAGTLGNGSATRVTFIAGNYDITGNVVDPLGPFSIDASFSVE